MVSYEVERPLPDEIPSKYLARAKDEIDRQLKLAQRTKDKELIRKWEELAANPEKRAYDLWVLEHPSAHLVANAKPATALLDTLRTLKLSVDKFDIGFTPEERDYLEEREKEYKEEYDFNNSSDAIMLRTTLIIELHLLQQTVLLQYDANGGSDVLGRVSALIKQLQMMHDSLSALRKQRVPSAAKAKESKTNDVLNPFTEVTKRYEENEDRAEELQRDMDEQTKAFLRRRKERAAQIEVVEYDGEENDFFDTEDS